MADKTRLIILNRLFVPAVRYCLRNCIDFRSVLESLKTVLVELAQEEIEGSGNEVTISRINAMTGLNRRDVGRIYRGEKTKHKPENLGSRVLGVWAQDSRYLTKARKPRVLSYKGKDSEFKALVKSVSRELNPATVLFELVRTGAVKRTEKGVRLLQEIDYYNKRPEKGFDLLVRDIDTLVTAVEENLLSPRATRNLHIRTEYDNIRVRDIPKIRKWLLRQGQMFHKRARTYLAKHDVEVDPENSEEAGARVVLGAYSWTGDET